MPSFIFIHPTVWPQYTNVQDRQDRTDRQVSRPDNQIASGEPFYKRLPNKIITSPMGVVAKYCDEYVCLCLCVCLSARMSPEPHS